MSRFRLATHQIGIAHLGIILGVLLLAVIGFAGYRVWLNNQPADTATTQTTTESTDSNGTITTPEQLDQTASELDSASAELDQDLNGSSLDDDISSML